MSHMSGEKWGNEEMRKWGNEEMSSDKNRFWQVRLVGQIGQVRESGRKRRSSEEGREGFWWKKGVRWVGLAYRELIESLYESWTIGIEKVYK